MRILRKGIGTKLGAPTLRSVRRLQNLNQALREINPRPIGIDGFPREAYLKPVEYVRWNPNFADEYPCLRCLAVVQDALSRKFFYEPDPVVPHEIRGREVLCGTTANRIIERAIARKLTIYFDPYLSDSCGAYRPGRSPEDMILRVRQAIKSGCYFAVKADIRHFFEAVRRDILKTLLVESLSDQGLVCFILDALAPFHYTRLGFIKAGLPQGNILSPVLGNLYLHHVDLACQHLPYFRYSDDLLLLGKEPNEVIRQFKLLSRMLAQLGLSLNSEKTKFADLHNQPVQFLGYELRGRNVFPPQQAIARLEYQLRRIREHGGRKALMTQFVRRFRIGPVRKLFRGIDRDLRPLYPPGLTLTGLLDAARRETKAVKVGETAGPRGNAA